MSHAGTIKRDMYRPNPPSARAGPSSALPKRLGFSDDETDEPKPKSKLVPVRTTQKPSWVPSTRRDEEERSRVVSGDIGDRELRAGPDAFGTGSHSRRRSRSRSRSRERRDWDRDRRSSPSRDFRDMGRADTRAPVRYDDAEPGREKLRTDSWRAPSHAYDRDASYQSSSYDDRNREQGGYGQRYDDRRRGGRYDDYPRDRGDDGRDRDDGHRRQYSGASRRSDRDDRDRPRGGREDRERDTARSGERARGGERERSLEREYERDRDRQRDRPRNSARDDDRDGRNGHRDADRDKDARSSARKVSSYVPTRPPSESSHEEGEISDGEIPPERSPQPVVRKIVRPFEPRAPRPPTPPVPSPKESPPTAPPDPPPRIPTPPPPTETAPPPPDAATPPFEPASPVSKPLGENPFLAEHYARAEDKKRAPPASAPKGPRGAQPEGVAPSPYGRPIQESERPRFTRRTLEEEERVLGRTFKGITALEDYVVSDKIGEGTFGVVTKARERVGGRAVALKKLITHNPRDGISVTTVREIKILKSLEHDNVVPLISMVVQKKHPNDRTERGEVYMVFPYMDHDLCGLLANKGFIPRPTINKLILKQILEGLAYIHAKHFIHRDIKTANILVNRRGQAMIADFGLARSFTSDGVLPAHSANEYTNMVVTRWYRAPELLLGSQHYTQKIDLWSVGCVFGEMYWRSPIFCGQSDRDQLWQIITHCGPFTDEVWPGWRDLPGFPEESSTTWEKIRPGVSLYELGKQWQMDPVAVDLLASLLTLDPAIRPTAAEALDHPWFYTGLNAAEFKDNLIGVESSHEMTTGPNREAAHAPRVPPTRAPVPPVRPSGPAAHARPPPHASHPANMPGRGPPMGGPPQGYPGGPGPYAPPNGMSHGAPPFASGGPSLPPRPMAPGVVPTAPFQLAGGAAAPPAPFTLAGPAGGSRMQGGPGGHMGNGRGPYGGPAGAGAGAGMNGQGPGQGQGFAGANPYANGGGPYVHAPAWDNRHGAGPGPGQGHGQGQQGYGQGGQGGWSGAGPPSQYQGQMMGQGMEPGMGMGGTYSLPPAMPPGWGSGPGHGQGQGQGYGPGRGASRPRPESVDTLRYGP